MSLLFTGPNRLTEWIEDAAFGAIVNGPESVEYRPKLVQILSRGGPPQKPFLILHDGHTSCAAFVSSEISKDITRGCIVMIYEWSVSSVQVCAGEYYEQLTRAPPNATSRAALQSLLSTPICLAAKEVKLMGGQGIGVIGNAQDVNDSIEVRRALQSINYNHDALCARLKIEATLGNVATLLQQEDGVRSILQQQNTVGNLTKVLQASRETDGEDDDAMAAILAMAAAEQEKEDGKDPNEPTRNFATVLPASREIDRDDEDAMAAILAMAAAEQEKEDGKDSNVTTSQSQQQQQPASGSGTDTNPQQQQDSGTALGNLADLFDVSRHENEGNPVHDLLDLANQERRTSSSPPLSRVPIFGNVTDLFAGALGSVFGGARSAEQSVPEEDANTDNAATAKNGPVVESRVKGLAEDKSDSGGEEEEEFVGISDMLVSQHEEEEESDNAQSVENNVRRRSKRDKRPPRGKTILPPKDTPQEELDTENAATNQDTANENRENTEALSKSASTQEDNTSSTRNVVGKRKAAVEFSHSTRPLKQHRANIFFEELMQHAQKENAGVFTVKCDKRNTNGAAGDVRSWLDSCVVQHSSAR